MSPRVLTFPAARVRLFSDHVESVFIADGSVSRFYPPVGNPDFEYAARFAGYTDSLQFGIAHDIIHHAVAERLGQPHSKVIWCEAHGQDRSIYPQEELDFEEHCVVRLQRFINIGELDTDYGVLIGQFGTDLPAIAREAMFLVCPWLG